MLGWINNCLTFGQNIPPPKNSTIKFTILQRSLLGHDSSIMIHQEVKIKILTHRKSKFHLVCHNVSSFSQVAPHEYFSTMTTHRILKKIKYPFFHYAPDKKTELTGQKNRKKNIFPFPQAKQNRDNNPWCDCILRISTANMYSHLKSEILNQ